MKPLPKHLVFGTLATGLLAVGGYVWLQGRTSLPSSSTPALATDTVAAKEAAVDPLLSELLADDYADAEELEYYDRNAVRRALLAEQTRATGKRAVAVAYLLAALDEDYARNRDIVLAALEARLADPTEDDDAIEYAISLCKRGDQSLRRPLFAAAARCVGESAELLGTFYADLIASDLDGFLDVLSRFHADEQRRIADLMAQSLVVTPEEQVSDDQFDDIYETLTHRAAQGKSDIRAAARRCVEALDRELADDGATPAALLVHGVRKPSPFAK
ncbi:MAG: hypothetical protein NZ585_12320 [Chloracidobacterium sp.]|nr:hypothetical protein [Chloracidobacterium sp.]MDW8216211.1 hypothetical protein [Acidobacteriota bacterium]